MIFDFAFQLSAAILPAQAQPTDKAIANQFVNAKLTAKGQLLITPSKTSSKNDFDFLISSWNITNKKLKTRLHNSNEWVSFNAKHEAKKILNGIGNTDVMYANINNTDFEGRTLRLFDPKTRLWSLYWTDSNTGKLDIPVVGSFDGNIGSFYTKDTWEGKKIIMRFKWDKTNPDKPIWSQAFSADNGKTWEWNWYMYFERADNTAKDPELSENQTIKVLELRNYILKPGKRDDFINYFEKHFITSQNILGGYVLGQFRIKGVENRFVWLRGFDDMAARSTYLPEFYRKSLVWKKFKAGANALIDDNDHVYLLKPLNDSGNPTEESKGINANDFAKHKGIVVIDYYTANDGKLDELINLYKRHFPKANNTSLWVTELTPNDFPSLPVIQDKNLLVSITFYKDEEEYESKLKVTESNKDLQNQLEKLLKNKETMTIYPTKKSFGMVEE